MEINSVMNTRNHRRSYHFGTKLHLEYYEILSCIFTNQLLRTFLFLILVVLKVHSELMPTFRPGTRIMMDPNSFHNVWDCCALFFGRSSQNESAMILREHSDTDLRTIKIHSCDEIMKSSKTLPNLYKTASCLLQDSELHFY